MEDGLFNIKLRDGWALLLLLGIGGMVAWQCQSESRFAFFMTVSASSGSTASEKQAADDSTIEPIENGTSTIGQP
jgi:hypothetical protein